MTQPPSPGLDQPRSAPRHKIFEPTRLLIAGVETRAHLINISLSGALVHVAALSPRHGEQVQVEIAGAMVAGQVRWVSAPRFGIAFSAPLDPTHLTRLLGD